MRGIGAVVVVAALSGCTSVKLVQRDGCWVRRTEKPFGRVMEEIGPCALPAPPWVEDRLTRLVQECVARADYRWQSRALAAWNRSEKLPDQDEGNLLKECMSEASGAMITQKEALEARLAEVSRDRDALRERTEADGSHLRASYDKIADYLGEAAKKPSPPATATATASSDGRASTESAASPQTAPVAIVGVAPVTASCEPAKKADAVRRTRAGKKDVRPVLAHAKAAPECPPAPGQARVEAGAPAAAPGVAVPDGAASANGTGVATPAAPAGNGGR